jgi:hypothetical protein
MKDYVSHVVKIATKFIARNFAFSYDKSMPIFAVLWAGLMGI